MAHGRRQKLLPKCELRIGDITIESRYINLNIWMVVITYEGKCNRDPDAYRNRKSSFETKKRMLNTYIKSILLYSR